MRVLVIFSILVAVFGSFSCCMEYHYDKILELIPKTNNIIRIVIQKKCFWEMAKIIFFSLAATIYVLAMLFMIFILMNL